MTGKTSIEWATAVWNPTTGCTRVSAGCDNCYAFALHDKRYKVNRDAAEAGGVRGHQLDTRDRRDFAQVARERGIPLPYPKQYDLPFSRVQLLPDRLDDPLRHRKPERYFVDSMADLFHEDVPDEFVTRVWRTMYIAEQHTFLVLTKRPERMRAFLERFKPTPDWDGYVTRDGVTSNAVGRGGLVVASDKWPLPNVWLGTSVEDQAAADERIPHLLATPAAVRFLSCEPLLGPVDLTRFGPGERTWHGLDGEVVERDPGVGWVIVGGESGARARPMDLAWARLLVQQCRAAGVASFVKQLGSRPVDEWPVRGLPQDAPHQAFGSEDDPRCELTLRDRKGGDMAEWPEDLRVRDFPR